MRYYWTLWFLPDGRECAVKCYAESRIAAENMPPPAPGATHFATWLDLCHEDEDGARFGLAPGRGLRYDVPGPDEPALANRQKRLTKTHR